MSYIAIDLESKVAPFEQIKASIIGLIAAGDLAADHKLPTIRQLAGDLGVAPNTVARAYRELELAGLVRSLGRRGTTVVGLPAPRSTAAVTIDPVVAAVADARSNGTPSGEILAAVIAALATSS